MAEHPSSAGLQVSAGTRTASTHAHAGTNTHTHAHTHAHIHARTRIRTHSAQRTRTACAPHRRGRMHHLVACDLTSQEQALKILWNITCDENRFGIGKEVRRPGRGRVPASSRSHLAKPKLSPLLALLPLRVAPSAAFLADLLPLERERGRAPRPACGPSPAGPDGVRA